MEGLSYTRILSLSIKAMILEAAQPLAVLVAVGLLGHAKDSGPKNSQLVAAFAAVEASITFVCSVFNFLLTVTMTQVAKARAQRDSRYIVSRSIWAVVTSVCLGVFSALLLLACHRPLFQVFMLESHVESMAAPYLFWRIGALPLRFVQRACMGILAGNQWINSLMGAQLFYASSYLLGIYTVIRFSDGDLPKVGMAILVAMFASTLPFLWLAFSATRQSVMASERRRASLPNQSTVPGEMTSDGGESESSDTDLPQREKTEKYAFMASFKEYVVKSGNLIIRSFLLQATVFAMSIAASRLGTQTLAAHQVAIQLWMVTSYIIDGFADCGTMLGTGYVSANKLWKMRLLTLRLSIMTAACGMGVTAIMLGARDPIQRLFTSDSETLGVLDQVWLVISLMQLPNSSVFLYDGLLYAFEGYSFVRNVMLFGFFLLYLPSLLTSQLAFHSWLGLWLSKAILNAWRSITALVYVWSRCWKLQEPNSIHQTEATPLLTN